MSRAQVPPLDQGIFLVHLSRARKHLAEERFDLARQELELAELARPNDEDVLNLLSVIEFKRGYYHEAAQAARALLEKNPSSAVLHCNLGLILFKAGVLGEAEQELRKAVDLKPDHLRSHLYLGLLYRMRGKLGLAVEHLKFAGANRVVTEIEESLRRTAREGPLPRSAVPEEPTPIRPGAAERRPTEVEAAPFSAPEPPPFAAADSSPFQIPDDLLSETAVRQGRGRDRAAAGGGNPGRAGASGDGGVTHVRDSGPSRFGRLGVDGKDSCDIDRRLVAGRVDAELLA